MSSNADEAVVSGEKTNEEAKNTIDNPGKTDNQEIVNEAGEAPGGEKSEKTESKPARTKLEEKRRTRELKHMEETMKALSKLSKEEKLEALLKKYASLMEENRLTQKTLKETEKLYNGVVKEKDRLNQEHQKTLFAKTKLETLCRELQKCNRAIKEESLEQVQLQEVKRKELSDKFRDTLGDIQVAMETGRVRSEKLSAENKLLSEKLTALVEQYQAKEEYTKRIVETRDLEIQLMQTKLKSATVKLEHLTEEGLKDKQLLLSKLKEREEQIKEMLDCEKSLREQLTIYSTKYEEFQSNLAESNDSFHKFKNEMEKDGRKWRKKFEESNQALIDAAEGKLGAEKKLVEERKAHQQLEKLTRALQEERTTLLKQLKVCKETKEEQEENVIACTEKQQISPRDVTAEDEINSNLVLPNNTPQSVASF